MPRFHSAALALTLTTLAFAVSSPTTVLAVLPPGYEDRLLCGEGFCKRDKQVSAGWVGPASQFHECFNEETNEVVSVTSWGSMSDGQGRLDELRATGFHEHGCAVPVDPGVDGDNNSNKNRNNDHNNGIRLRRKLQLTTGRACCRALTAGCQSCVMGMTVQEFCRGHCGHMRPVMTTPKTQADDIACRTCPVSKAGSPNLLAAGDTCRFTPDGGSTWPTDRKDDCPDYHVCKSTRSPFSFVIGGPETYTCQEMDWTSTFSVADGGE